MRELAILGTDSQVPTRTRNHNGYFLRWEREGHRIEAYGYRLTEPDGRTLLPDRLAAAGIAGPDIGDLQL